MKQPFPETRKNDSAIKLEEFAEALGIKNKYDNYPPYLSILSYDVKGEISNYHDQELKRPDNKVSAPPARLKKYLEIHANEIDAICDYFTNHEAPEWGTASIKDHSIDVIFNMVDLHRVMIAFALDKLNAGKHQDALRIMDTEWKINQSLENAHNLMTTRLSGSHLKDFAVMLRKINNVPPYWHNRLKDDKHPEAMLFQLEKEILIFNDFELMVKDKLKSEAFLRSERNHPDKRYEDVQPDRAEELRWKYIIGPLIKPYYRICVAEYSKRASEFIGQVHKKNDICTSDQYSFIRRETPYSSWNEVQIPHAYWNEIDPIFHFFPYQHYLFPLEVVWLNIELTDKVLKIKEAKAVSPDGKWPTSIPGIESSICQGARWNYRVTPDGKMCISINKPPASYSKEYLNPSWLLPLTYCQKIGVNH